MQLPRVHRAVGASLGLLITGAFVGAGIGVFVLAIWGLIADGPGGFPYAWFAFEFAAVLGALLGGVLLPLVAWTVLPHVAFGRILMETGTGRAAGAALGIIALGSANLLSGVIGGVLGFVASMLQLRLRRPKGPRVNASVSDAT